MSERTPTLRAPPHTNTNTRPHKYRKHRQHIHKNKLQSTGGGCLAVFGLLLYQQPLKIKAPLSNNGYKLPKIIWQPGSIQGLSALHNSPSVTRTHKHTHTVTAAACICYHLLQPPFFLTLLRFISPKGDFLVGHGDNPPPLTTLPHKLPGGIGTVTGSSSLPWALGRGAEVEVRLCVNVCVCVGGGTCL